MIKRSRGVAFYRFSRACTDCYPCSPATLVSSGTRRIGTIQHANSTPLGLARQLGEGRLLVALDPSNEARTDRSANAIVLNVLRRSWVSIPPYRDFSENRLDHHGAS
jgi:hypothetical protein